MCSVGMVGSKGRWQMGPAFDRGFEFPGAQAVVVERFHACPGGQDTARLTDEAAGRRAKRGGRVRERMDTGLAVVHCADQTVRLCHLCPFPESLCDQTSPA